MDNDQLPPAIRENRNDLAAAALRGTLGNLPGGAFISELVNRIIPGQRQERLATYLAGLARRLSVAEGSVETLVACLTTEKVALFEDGAAGTIHATTDERIRHLVEIVAAGIEGGAREADDQRAILRLLNDLTDGDIRYLLLWTARYGDDQEWRRANGYEYQMEKCADGQVLPIGAPEIDPIVDSYRTNRLVALGLLRRRTLQGPNGGPARPGWDQVIEISLEGTGLLRRIGLLSEEEV